MPHYQYQTKQVAEPIVCSYFKDFTYKFFFLKALDLVAGTIEDSK